MAFLLEEVSNKTPLRVGQRAGIALFRALTAMGWLIAITTFWLILAGRECCRAFTPNAHLFQAPAYGHVMHGEACSPAEGVRELAECCQRVFFNKLT